MLKSINHEAHAGPHAEVRWRPKRSRACIVVDHYLPADEKDALIADCDCYVSLHRSEGFGITMAEAMLLGKPVIATDYSGSKDFIRADTAFPVRYELAPIGAGKDPYPADGEWAEPDLDHAAELMRTVREDPAAAAARGAAGREFVRMNHSPEVAGAALAARLARIRRSRPARMSRRVRAHQAFEATSDLLDEGVPRGPGRRISPRRLLRSASIRLAGPVLYQQRRADRALLWALAEDAASARERADLARAQAESNALAAHRRLERELAELRAEMGMATLPSPAARPAISLVVYSGGDPTRLRGLLDTCRPHVDEIVVAVDRNRDADGLLDACADLADQRFVLDSFVYEDQAPWLHRQATGDWILRLDDDEMPSTAMLQALPGLVTDRGPTHHAFRRRWLTPDGGHYLRERPWYPDYQTRLVRNIPGILLFGGLHEVPRAMGELRYNQLALYHGDLAVNDLEARTARREQYERLAPGVETDGFPVNDMYVPELVGDIAAERVPAEDTELVGRLLSGDGAAPGPTRSVPRPVDAAEVLRFAPRAGGARQDDERRGCLRVVDAPETMPADAMRHVQCVVRNDGDADWSWEGLPDGSDVVVGSRWLDSGGRLIGDGPLTGFPESVAPGAAVHMFAAVRAPVEPGRYTLELDLLGNRTAWFGAGERLSVEVSGAHA